MKLSDTALVMLSAAAQRADRGLEMPSKLKSVAAARVIEKLISQGLVETVQARGPVWRRGEDNRPSALRITKAGLRLINVAEPDQSSGSRESAAEPRAIAPLVQPGRGTASRPRKRDSASQSGLDSGPVVAEPSNAGRGGSKQAHVITMLQHPHGTTIAAVMQMTGWQAHSVRGFFAGALRTRLGLTLVSEVVEGTRVYRIPSGGEEGAVLQRSRAA